MKGKAGNAAVRIVLAHNGEKRIFQSQRAPHLIPVEHDRSAAADYLNLYCPSGIARTIRFQILEFSDIAGKSSYFFSHSSSIHCDIPGGCRGIAVAGGTCGIEFHFEKIYCSRGADMEAHLFISYDSEAADRNGSSRVRSEQEEFGRNGEFLSLISPFYLYRGFGRSTYIRSVGS